MFLFLNEQKFYKKINTNIFEKFDSENLIILLII